MQRHKERGQGDKLQEWVIRKEMEQGKEQTRAELGQVNSKFSKKSKGSLKLSLAKC